MEDDYSRKAWAKRLDGPATDDLVTYWMEYLHPDSYENLLTDNGKQFASNNSRMREVLRAVSNRQAHLVIRASSSNSWKAIKLPEGTQIVPSS